MLMTGQGRKLADRRSSPPTEQSKCIFQTITGGKRVIIKCCHLMVTFTGGFTDL